MIDVFIVFAPEDQALLMELERHLQSLVVEELITIWHERKMMAGMDVEQESAKHWNGSSIILLLLSANFMATSACYKRGIEALEKSKAQKGIHVIPVLLKEVDWEQTRFGTLNPLPANRKAIRSWNDQDAAYRKVVEGIREVIAPPKSAKTNTASSSTSAVDKRDKGPSVSHNIENKLFDVFISYNSKDRPEVKEIAKQLRDRGLKPWFDEWELRPGLSWQRALEMQIEQIYAAAVFVGKEGIGPWQRMEMEAYIRNFVNRGSPVIPVLLKDAPEKPSLPTFLAGMTYIDFRKSEEDVSPMDQLIWGITGQNPNDHGQGENGVNIDKFASKNVEIQMNVGGSGGVGKKLSSEEMRQLVEKFLACPSMGDRHSRDTVVQQLGDEISHVIARSGVDKVDVMNIIRTCLNFSNGLQELIDAVAFLEGYSLPMQRLRAFVQGI